MGHHKSQSTPVEVFWSFFGLWMILKNTSIILELALELSQTLRAIVPLIYK